MPVRSIVSAGANFWIVAAKKDGAARAMVSPAPVKRIFWPRATSPSSPRLPASVMVWAVVKAESWIVPGRRRAWGRRDSRRFEGGML